MNENRRAGKLKPFAPRPPEALFSPPDAITLLRLAGSLTFFALAVLKQRELFNFIGLGIHWFGDVADGGWARKFRQETILGAEMDIVADRIEALVFFVNFLHFRPSLTVPVLIYALDFAFVDLYLSYQFVKFDIISINYFYRVDEKVFALNFSSGGKFVNSTIVPLILILLPRLWPAAVALSAGLIAVKTSSAVRLWKIRREPSLARPRMS